MGEADVDELTSERPPLVDLPGAWPFVLGIAGAAVLVAWGNVVLQGFKQPSDVDDIAGNRFLDASAIQISQLADQATVRLLGALSIAGGITGAFVVLLAFALLFSARR